MPIEYDGHTWYDLGRAAWIDTGTYTTSGITTGHYDWVVNTTGWENTPYTVTFNTATTSANTLNLWRDNVRIDREIDRAAAQIEATAEEVSRARRDRSDARALAVARGEQLLLSLLDEAQIASYRLDGHFEVIGSHGTLYRVHRGTSGNIEWIKADGSVGGRLCAHPTMAHDWLPTEDVMLAQLLALQHNEREFVRVANVHAGTRPPMREVARARWEQSVVA